MARCWTWIIVFESRSVETIMVSMMIYGEQVSYSMACCRTWIVVFESRTMEIWMLSRRYHSIILLELRFCTHVTLCLTNVSFVYLT
jgi:hypothetical protein